MRTRILLGLTAAALTLIGAGCAPQPAVPENPAEPSAAVNEPTNANQPVAAPKPAAPAPVPTPKPAAATIDMNNGGFSPSVVTVTMGSKVTFVNRGNKSMWPASDPHPTHTALAGFDRKQGVAPTESWSYTFTKKGTFTYHDHLSPLLTGTVIVK